MVSLAIFLVAELTVITTVQASQIVISNKNNQEIVVDNNGEGDFKTIQAAIDNAQPGSTIYIKKGEYKEIITIKKQISLIGEDKDGTLINPISEKNKFALYLGAPNIKIQGLSIQNGAPGLYASAIRIASSNIEVNDCNIYDTPVGIIVWTSNNIIDNCNFWRCEDEGIALIGTSYSDCKNNIITNCVFRDNCDGIELQYSSSNTILNCDFYDNTHTGIDAIASSNDENTISNCRIFNNKAQGIYFSSSSNNLIKDCFIYDNKNGNIVTDINSENNQIISNSNSIIDDNELSLREILQYGLSRRSTDRFREIVSLLRSLISF